MTTHQITQFIKQNLNLKSHPFLHILIYYKRIFILRYNFFEHLKNIHREYVQKCQNHKNCWALQYSKYCFTKQNKTKTKLKQKSNSVMTLETMTWSVKNYLQNISTTAPNYCYAGLQQHDTADIYYVPCFLSVWTKSLSFSKSFLLLLYTHTHT